MPNPVSVLLTQMSGFPIMETQFDAKLETTYHDHWVGLPYDV